MGAVLGFEFLAEMGVELGVLVGTECLEQHKLVQWCWKY